MLFFLTHLLKFMHQKGDSLHFPAHIRRRFIEAGAEARLPLKNYKLPGTAYAFAEFGSDLGSASSVPGNPTEYYRKAGRGLSYGVGMKAFGACRFEYARDCNAGNGSVFVHWGERY